MEAALVQRFLNVFRDYIVMCMNEDFPDNNTNEGELKRAFLLAQHIERCLDKLQLKGVIDQFLLALFKYQDTPDDAVKICLMDPPKYILTKFLNSNININQMDVSIKLYLEVFSAEKFETYLTAIMLESASKETLLNNLNKDLDKDKILSFKSVVMLTELKKCNLMILDIVSNCNEATVEVLVYCLLNSDEKFRAVVNLIKDIFVNIFSSRDCVYRNFFKLLFKVDDKYFLEMCIKHFDIYKLSVEALLDYGKLLREGLSTDLFYIDLGQSELQNIVKRICSNDSLQLQFFDMVNKCDTNIEFWRSML